MSPHALIPTLFMLVVTASSLMLGFSFWRWRRKQKEKRRRDLDREWRRQQRWPEQRETAGIEPPPRPVAELEVAAKVEATVKGGRRCPYCHSDVEPLSGVVCATCLARHHEPCWDEHRACSACGAAERFTSVERTEPRERA